MGLFDTMISADGLIEIQTKIGPCCMCEYTIGDNVYPDFEDGMYGDFDGFFIIKDGTLVYVGKREPPEHLRKTKEPDRLALRKWAREVIKEITNYDNTESEVLFDLARKGKEILDE